MSAVSPSMMELAAAEPVDYENPWLFGTVALADSHIEKYVAMVYLITNNETGRKYIGKKIFEFTNRVKRAGKKRRVVKKKPSDWKTYYGSSDELLADIEKYGANNFTRGVLWLCESKKQSAYYEVMELFKRDVLSNRDLYYNSNISGKFFPRDLI